MKKSAPMTIFFALVALAVLGGGFYYYGPYKSEKEKTAVADSGTEVVTGTIEALVTAQGKLEPKDYVDVGAQVSGLVKTLAVEIGDQVEQGQLIAQIDPDVYESRVRADEARLKTLRAQLDEQEALTRLAQTKYTRNQTLIAQNAISREALEDTQTSLETAKAGIASLKAQIEEAQSTLDGDKANLSFTKIYAPMNGTVVSQSVKEGQTINANQTAPVIVQVANLDVMTARAQVAEADIPSISTGTPVYFTTLGSSGRRWEGTVRQVLPSPETVNDVVLYNVLVDVENKDHALMTGMTTQMFFVLGKAENVPVIPVAALGDRVPDKDTEDGKAYNVKMAGKTNETRVVITGLSNRTQAAVLDGLKPGERIIARTPPAKSNDNKPTGATRMPRL